MITPAPETQRRLATNFLGGIAISKVVLRAMEKGLTPSQPLIECRYDLIIDDGFKPHRVQVKYLGDRKAPHQTNGVIPVGLGKWRTGGRRSLPRYTTDEVDAVVVYVRAIDQILWFGPEIFANRTMLFIRLAPCRNGQKKGCLMAEDYLW